MALQPESTLQEMDPNLVKFHQRLLEKVMHCKEVLINIRTASATGLAVQEENDTIKSAVSAVPDPSNLPNLRAATNLRMRTSKVSLR